MKKSFLLLSLLPCFLFADKRMLTAPPSPPPDPEKEAQLFNKNEPGFLINGEFIYWNVQEGALDYAIRMRNRSWGPTPSFAQGDFERAEFDWDPGYRFSLGYYRAENFWEVLGEYTFLHVKGFNRVKPTSVDEAKYINGTFPQYLLGPMHHATSSIHLHYQLFNLLANRVFHPFDNPHLRLRLAGGVTTVWLHQGWRVRYIGFNDNVTTTRNRWRYWGMGLRVGTGFDWYWGKDIYATGTFSTALTMGRYRNHAKQTTNIPSNPGDNPNIPIRDARYKDYRMAFTMQFLVRPSYQKSFDWWRLEIFAGYELTIWSNLQEVFRSTGSTSIDAKETWLNSGLIALHGLTTRASFNF
ncbi:Lpg1974 family pore-forming outer membrane protein [Simkania sp.]|uniref:Lpg1974 family pore-forming outer membrane protein n=1 Tax=Simkania sp. TaxID=34094 RepID=UPI003B51C466